MSAEERQAARGMMQKGELGRSPAEQRAGFDELFASRPLGDDVTLAERTYGGVPALEAELYDGTDTLTVLWLGRRRIAGIFPGRSIRVTGRIGVHDGSRIIYNPRYDLRY